MADTLELAKTIAANSPVAVVGTKRSLVYSRDHTVADGLIHVATHNISVLMTDDISTAMISAMKKKSAKFRKIPKLSKL